MGNVPKHKRRRKGPSSASREAGTWNRAEPTKKRSKLLGTFVHKANDLRCDVTERVRALLQWFSVKCKKIQSQLSDRTQHHHYSEHLVVLDSKGRVSGRFSRSYRDLCSSSCSDKSTTSFLPLASSSCSRASSINNWTDEEDSSQRVLPPKRRPSSLSERIPNESRLFSQQRKSELLPEHIRCHRRRGKLGLQPPREELAGIDHLQTTRKRCCGTYRNTKCPQSSNTPQKLLPQNILLPEKTPAFPEKTLKKETERFSSEAISKRDGAKFNGEGRAGFADLEYGTRKAQSMQKSIHNPGTTAVCNVKCITPHHEQTEPLDIHRHKRQPPFDERSRLNSIPFNTKTKTAPFLGRVVSATPAHEASLDDPTSFFLLDRPSPRNSLTPPLNTQSLLEFYCGPSPNYFTLPNSTTLNLSEKQHKATDHPCCLHNISDERATPQVPKIQGFCGASSAKTHDELPPLSLSSSVQKNEGIRKNSTFALLRSYRSSQGSSLQGRRHWLSQTNLAEGEQSDNQQLPPIDVILSSACLFDPDGTIHPQDQLDSLLKKYAVPPDLRTSSIPRGIGGGGSKPPLSQPISARRASSCCCTATAVTAANGAGILLKPVFRPVITTSNLSCCTSAPSSNSEVTVCEFPFRGRRNAAAASRSRGALSANDLLRSFEGFLKYMATISCRKAFPTIFSGQHENGRLVPDHPLTVHPAARRLFKTPATRRQLTVLSVQLGNASKSDVPCLCSAGAADASIELCPMHPSPRTTAAFPLVGPTEAWLQQQETRLQKETWAA